MSLKKSLKETPSQTAGPYVHIGTLPEVAGIEVATHHTPDRTGLDGGTPAIIKGTIRDGNGELVKDAMVEIWQAGADGNYHAGRTGWARSHTDFETGEFRFETVKPGPVAAAGGVGKQAPHITLMVFARGINLHLHTRIYFSDEDAANAADPLLNAIADEDRRNTLLARPESGGNNAWRFDVVLQGEGETVFLDI
jgi:protocatechuate 3,4-dioxygenase alpha subunit